jgi:hypothetical protein
VAASVAANILHARSNPVSQVIAGWPPLALLLTVELISRVPVHRRALAAVRLVATTVIAGIAAWVSYWHMAGVAARYGETGPSAYLLPLSVDGLVIVASVSLVELAGRIRAVEAEAAAAPPPTVQAPTAAIEPAAVEPAVSEEAPADSQPERSPARRTSRPRAAKAAPAKAAPRKKAAAKTTPPGASPSATEVAELAAQIKADRPDVTPAALAAELGITTQRLSQLRREGVAA